MSDANKHFLAFIISEGGDELEIHVDAEGIQYLINVLTLLRDGRAGTHEHLFGPTWGSDDLTELAGSQGGVIRHVLIQMHKEAPR